MSEGKIILEFIIPFFGTFNELAERAVLSVLSQSEPEDTALILVNDNHPGWDKESDSKQIHAFVNEHNAHGIPFTYIENEVNKGVGETRNVGIRHATGEFVAFLDCDDELHKDFAKKFKAHRLLNVHGFDVFVGVHQFLGLKVDGKDNNWMSNSITWTHGKAYRREHLVSNNYLFPDIRYNEDGGFNQLVFECTPEERVYFDESSQVYYYRHEREGSLSKDRDPGFRYARYVETMQYCYERILKTQDLSKPGRIFVVICQLYWFYHSLVWNNEEHAEMEDALVRFFNAIRFSKWYDVPVTREQFAKNFVACVSYPCVPTQTFGEFLRKFSGDPIPFD